MNAEGRGWGPAVEEYGTEMTAGWLATEAEITVYWGYRYLFYFGPLFLQQALYQFEREKFLYLSLIFLK